MRQLLLQNARATLLQITSKLLQNKLDFCHYKMGLVSTKSGSYYKIRWFITKCDSLPDHRDPLIKY